MKYLFIILAVGLVGCQGTKPTSSTITNGKEKCFMAGGVEYHGGYSGGSLHSVCVFKNVP